MMLMLVAIAAIAFVPSVALAQGGTGQIGGRVTDEQGAVVPGVTITLVNQATGVQRTTVTDAEGAYRFPALGPGTYTVHGELLGFSKHEVTNIEMTIGLELVQDMTLRLQAVQETLTVTGRAPVVDTTKSEVAGVVTQQQIEALAMQSRHC